MLGIGIITFNRIEKLKNTVNSIKKYTSSNYKLVVADDGSTDTSVQWCIENNIRVITGENRGVCWNKNRALFALQEMGCDPILLLEDDCFPVELGWQFYWLVSIALDDHVSYAHPKLSSNNLLGSGTPQDPFVNNKATAQCSGISGIALREVGFLDSRFKGYGVGHAEWTSRIKKSGFGYRKVTLKDGVVAKANLYISGGLNSNDDVTYKDKNNILKNEVLFEQLKAEPIYRHPWSNPEEEFIFLEELSNAKLNGKTYLKNLSETSKCTALALRHSATYSKALNKIFEDDRSFILNSGYIKTIALNIPIYKKQIVPWFNYAVINLLLERVNPKWKVFEYGSGYSTLYWQYAVKNVHSVESDLDWFNLIRKLSINPDKILYKDNPVDFIDSITTFSTLYDLIVIDGIEREKCVENSLNNLKSDGVIIFDNTHRTIYNDALEIIRSKGFKELRLTAVTPMTIKEETTSIFYRNKNVLKI